MSKHVLRLAAALTVAAAIAGCGPASPAKTEMPAEPTFAATVRTTEPSTVASVAKTGPYGQTVKAAFGELMKWVGDNRVVSAGPVIGIYFDDPDHGDGVKPEEQRYEVCVPVPAGTKVDQKSGIVVKEMAPMMLATAIYVGAPEKMGEIFPKIRTWAVENGYEVVGPSVEVYALGQPEVVPESTKTEVGIVVAQKIPAVGGAAKTEGEKPAEETGK